MNCYILPEWTGDVEFGWPCVGEGGGVAVTLCFCFSKIFSNKAAKKKNTIITHLNEQL